MKSISLVLAAGVLASCGQQSEEPRQVASHDGTLPDTEDHSRQGSTRQLELAGQIYAVPAELLSAVRLGAENTFVRIMSPDVAADIVFDEKLNGLVDQAGAPQIFSINDGRYPNIAYHARSGRIIVCRAGMASRTGCGMRFKHIGVDWALLFPVGRLEDAEILLEEATTILDGFAHKQRKLSPDPASDENGQQ
ncbi:MAG: hypothetical protein AB7G25_08030 [Sphingomonadaceae bacterium]